MNLSPEWVQEFKLHNIEAVHWSAIGKFDAPDSIIMDWARKNKHTVFTHDLDFGTALALTSRKTKCYTSKNSKCDYSPFEQNAVADT